MDKEEMKTYTILKGLHYSAHWIKPIIFPKMMKFDFVLSNKSSYRPLTEHDERDTKQLKHQVNKIAGMSLDIFGKNSARLGYRYNWENGYFEIIPYYHLKGKKVWNEDRAIRIEKNIKYTCRIYKKKKLLCISVSEKYNPRKMVMHDILSVDIRNPIIGYRQYPHFGSSGNDSSAPKNIEILLDFY